MRRMRTNEWWADRLDDIAVLRAGLNARGIDGTDAQIAEAYAMWWSDELYAAGWMSVGDTAPPSFVGWVEREWLAPASGEPSGAEAVVREAYAVIDELAPQWSGSSIASVLRAYLERMAVPYPWRPIETAPKDGSRVLLAGCGENGGWVCVASWRGGRWRDGDYSIEPPTHWMPLPSAPGEGAGGGNDSE